MDHADLVKELVKIERDDLFYGIPYNLAGFDLNSVFDMPIEIVILQNDRHVLSVHVLTI